MCIHNAARATHDNAKLQRSVLTHLRETYTSQRALNMRIFYVIECAESLVKAGADTRARSSEGDMCIHIAARHGYSDIITLLAKHGAYTDERGQGKAQIDIGCYQVSLDWFKPQLGE